MTPELVIFDWDGTLCDSTGHIVAAMRTAFAEHDLTPPPRRAVLDVIGLALEHAVRELLPHGEDDSRAAALALAYRRHYASAQSRPTLYAGVHEVLGTLQAHGLMLAIATGKSGSGLRESLAHTGIGDCFCALRTADDAPPKPAPGMVLDILEALDTAPGRAVVVGDTLHDIGMAQAAGVPAIACLYGAHPRDVLLDSGAAYAIESIAELPALLDALG